jgi:hypothetical protein
MILLISRCCFFVVTFSGAYFDSNLTYRERLKAGRLLFALLLPHFSVVFCMSHHPVDFDRLQRVADIGRQSVFIAADIEDRTRTDKIGGREICMEIADVLPGGAFNDSDPHCQSRARSGVFFLEPFDLIEALDLH